MLEQLKTVAAMLTAMAGTSTIESLRDTLIAQSGEKDCDGNPVTYDKLTPRDKAEVDEAVAGMVAMGEVFDAAIDSKAVLCHKFYKSLQKAGFTATEALQIVASQGIDLGAKG